MSLTPEVRRTTESSGMKEAVGETRRAADGKALELVIREPGKAHVERFADLPKLMARERQLLTAWRTQGWKNADSGYAAVWWAS